ncbi:MAG: hypothetical protein R3F34_17380 [Planctomycetota bacterium]
MRSRSPLALGIVLALLALLVALLLDVGGGGTPDVVPHDAPSRPGAAAGDPQLATRGGAEGSLASTRAVAPDPDVAAVRDGPRVFTVSARGAIERFEGDGELFALDGAGAVAKTPVVRGVAQADEVAEGGVLELRVGDVRYVPLEADELVALLARHDEIAERDVVVHGDSSVRLDLRERFTNVPVESRTTFTALRRGKETGDAVVAVRAHGDVSAWSVDYPAGVESLRVEAEGYLPNDVVLPDPRATEREVTVALAASCAVRFEIASRAVDTGYRIEVVGPILSTPIELDVPADHGPSVAAAFQPGAYVAKLRTEPVRHGNFQMPRFCEAKAFAVERGDGETVVVLDAVRKEGEPEKGAIHLVVRHGDPGLEELPAQIEYSPWRETSRETGAMRTTFSPLRCPPSTFTLRAVPDVAGTSEWERTFENLEPGIYTIGSQESSYTERVVVEPGATTEVALDLGGPSAFLEVEVVHAATGERVVPVNLMWLRVNEYDAGAGPNGSCPYKELGEVSKLRTEAGRVMVSAFVLQSMEKRYQPSEIVELRPGEHRNLRLEIGDANATSWIKVQMPKAASPSGSIDHVFGSNDSLWARNALARLDDGRTVAATFAGWTSSGEHTAISIGFEGEDVAVAELLLPPHPVLGPMRAVKLAEPGPLREQWRFEPY